METDSGVLRRSLLSLKKEPFPRMGNFPFKTAIYKHYIIILDQNPESPEDCIVFDTEKGTTFCFHTGMSFKLRSGFSFSYWKDNIFVLYGGVLSLAGNQDLFNNSRQEADVHFMKFIEKDEQIFFEVESCGLKHMKWWSTDHSAEIYQDNMYIFAEITRGLFGGRGQGDQNKLTLRKFDLCTRTWSEYETVGDCPNLDKNQPTAVFNGKIYLVENCNEAQAQGREGLFGGVSRYMSLFALDLENMKWQKFFSRSLMENGEGQFLKQAEFVGDKIYLSGRGCKEFYIYAPSSRQLRFSDGLPPRDGWKIKSFENHAILFKFSNSFIEYQTLVLSPQGKSPSPQKQEKDIFKADPLVATPSQLSHMELLWKEKPFADVTFVVQNEEISAHRVILLKCRYFQNMFKSGMIEATSDKINVPEISPASFKAILEYIYCDKINLTEPLAMELIILADMYFLPKLKADCENYLSAKLTVENFVKVMKVAETADSEKLEKKVVNFLTSNIEKVKQDVDIHVIPPELFIKAVLELKSAKKN